MFPRLPDPLQPVMAWMQQNMNTYWRRFTDQPRRIAWLFSDYGIQWVVLGVLRQYYSFKEGVISLKLGAGDYALNCFPQRWHRLIQEVLNIRRGVQGIALSA